MNYQLIALLNAFVCAIIGVTCLCRIDRLNGNVSRRIKWLVGLRYIFLFVTSIGLAMSPWLWQTPGLTVLAFSSAVLFVILTDYKDWVDGPPYWLLRNYQKPSDEALRLLRDGAEQAKQQAKEQTNGT